MNERDLPKRMSAALSHTKQHSYHVGDHVSFGWNGDYDAGVVIRITDASVWVRRADLDLSSVQEGGKYMGRVFAEGDADVRWVDPPADNAVLHFKVRHSRRYRGACVAQDYYILGHGAMEGRNPHI